MARHESDFYETPATAAHEVLIEVLAGLPEGARMLDVGAGSGNLTRFALALRHDLQVDALELDPRHREVLVAAGAKNVIIADFLTWEPEGQYPDYHLIISNPPFSLAQEFVTRIWELARRSRRMAKIAVLARLGFLAGQKRRAWWRSLPEPKLRILSRRPSFTGHGADSTDYAWLLWATGGPDIAWYQG